VEADDFVMENEGFVLRQSTPTLPVVLCHLISQGVVCVVLNECSFNADNFLRKEEQAVMNLTQPIAPVIFKPSNTVSPHTPKHIPGCCKH
jgi:hypothetical protein